MERPKPFKMFAIVLINIILAPPSVLGLEVNATALNFTTYKIGNPFVRDMFGYADTMIDNGTFWVYSANFLNNPNNTAIDAHSSTNLLNWTGYTAVLSMGDFPWARGSIVSVASITRDQKYYLYFSVTTDYPYYDNYDTSSNFSTNFSSAIGVGVADKPQGPFKSAGSDSPLLRHNDSALGPTDNPSVLLSGGEAYLYYTSNSSAKVARLAENLTAVKASESTDGEITDVTPESASSHVSGNFSGSFKVFQRQAFYMIWKESENSKDWNTNDTVPAIRYAVTPTPFGPFAEYGEALKMDTAIATSLGHATVINVMGADIWYMVYSRKYMTGAASISGLAYDRIRFDSAGTMSVQMRVTENFDTSIPNWRKNANFFFWAPDKSGNQYLGLPPVQHGRLMFPSNFTDFTYDIWLQFPPELTPPYDSGVVFRVENSSIPNHPDPMLDFKGYYAGIRHNNRVIFGVVDGSWTELSSESLGSQKNLGWNHLRVKAEGNSISVFVNDFNKPLINVPNNMYSSGEIGIRTWNTTVFYEDMEVASSFG